MIKKPKIVVAITGASGAIYAQRFFLYLEKYQSQFEHVDVVMSENAKQVWEYELENKEYTSLAYSVFNNMDFNAPFASGSAGYDSLVIIPASMGTIGRIAHGISNNLISRAADVMLKERKQLIVVARESPYSLIHLRNMTQITEAGGIIVPATPSFYSRPKSVEELVDTVVIRVLQIIGIQTDSFSWGE